MTEQKWDTTGCPESMVLNVTNTPSARDDVFLDLKIDENKDKWFVNTERGNTLDFGKPRVFECPKHGIFNDEVISVTIKGFEGDYCMRCWIETLQKVTKI